MSVAGGGFNWSAQHTSLLAEDGVWALKQRRRIYYSGAQRSEIAGRLASRWVQSDADLTI
jgi:hypothetical protein